MRTLNRKNYIGVHMIELLNEFGYFVIVVLFVVAIVAGIVDTIAGGGGLITLPMLLFFNIPPATALGTNRLQATIGELSAIIFFINGVNNTRYNSNNKNYNYNKITKFI
jgi:uncharacterized membrane protein YbhN (UPF0104 family)